MSVILAPRCLGRRLSAQSGESDRIPAVFRSVTGDPADCAFPGRDVVTSRKPDVAEEGEQSAPKKGRPSCPPLRRSFISSGELA